MRNTWIYLTLFISCLFFICDYSEAPAQNNITILEHSIRPIETVSSGQFIKTAWKVKLCNHSGNPANCVITISFIGKDEYPLREEKEKIEMKANETKTYSGTVLLQAKLAQRIFSTKVSLEAEQIER